MCRCKTHISCLASASPPPGAAAAAATAAATSWPGSTARNSASRGAVAFWVLLTHRFVQMTCATNTAAEEATKAGKSPEAARLGLLQLPIPSSTAAKAPAPAVRATKRSANGVSSPNRSRASAPVRNFMPWAFEECAFFRTNSTSAEAPRPPPSSRKATKKSSKVLSTRVSGWCSGGARAASRSLRMSPPRFRYLSAVPSPAKMRFQSCSCQRVLVRSCPPWPPPGAISPPPPLSSAIAAAAGKDCGLPPERGKWLPLEPKHPGTAQNGK
mmetsp:Transcript_165650/g.531750  ORF Transcript_165650/g.531750 Transcript_165650/m.531750 type:complete len:270 (+) Transcript_165650:586-1395(+)